MTGPPRCRRCRRPLADELSLARHLGPRCWLLLVGRRRRRNFGAALSGLPPIIAYRTGTVIPGQTVIPIDEGPR